MMIRLFSPGPRKSVLQTVQKMSSDISRLEHIIDNASMNLPLVQKQKHACFWYFESTLRQEGLYCMSSKSCDLVKKLYASNLGLKTLPQISLMLIHV